MLEFGFNETVLFVTVHLTAVASAWLVRHTSHPITQRLSQIVFFTFLGLMGATTMIALRLLPEFWFISGFTLAAMVVTAVLDRRPSQQMSV